MIHHGGYKKMMNVATHASQSDACAGCKTARIHNQTAFQKAIKTQ
jgi:hypothetical protein